MDTFHPKSNPPELPSTAPPPAGYVRMQQLLPTVVPISPATLWRWVKLGKFPAPVKLGQRITAWRQSDIQQWLTKQAQRGGVAS